MTWEAIAECAAVRRASLCVLFVPVFAASFVAGGWECEQSEPKA